MRHDKAENVFAFEDWSIRLADEAKAAEFFRCRACLMRVGEA